MKKQFFFYKLGIIPLITLCCSVNAQTNGFNANLNTSSSKEVAWNDNTKDKELPHYIGNSSLSTKALKDFSKTFKGAGNAAWFEISDGFMAKFKKDEVETKVFYDRKGRWIANVRNYQENKLPKEIRHMVKSNYYDYSIFYVQEVTAGNQTAYLVKIEDKKSTKTIRIVDGEMDEYEAFEKSK
jgi:hypothetical protein